MGVVLIWLDFVLQPLRKEGDSNPRYPNRVRQFSKLVVSATHPSFQTSPSLKSSAKVDKKNKYAKYRAVIFFEIVAIIFAIVAVVALNQHYTMDVSVVVLILICEPRYGRINKMDYFTYL